jgi:trimethylamine:corrinoid methyltransferase-like protein
MTGRCGSEANSLEKLDLRTARRDWRTYGTWSADGARTATARANGLWQSKLERAEARATEPDVASAIDAFSKRRPAAGGALPRACTAESA